MPTPINFFLPDWELQVLRVLLWYLVTKRGVAPSNAEDFAQDVLLHVWEDRDRILSAMLNKCGDNVEAQRRFLFTVALNYLRDLLRKKRRLVANCELGPAALAAVCPTEHYYPEEVLDIEMTKEREREAQVEHERRRYQELKPIKKQVVDRLRQGWSVVKIVNERIISASTKIRWMENK